MSSRYAISMHGKLTRIGYLPAASCSACHGAHDIPPIDDAASPVSTANRGQTCSKCHEGASENFLRFDPHADPYDAERYPGLYWINRALTWMISTVFAVFGLHSALWLIRGVMHVLRHGRPARPTPGCKAIRRFATVHRSAHFVLMVSFLGLALTGLPLQYGGEQWGQATARALGGFESTGLWHRIFGITNIGCLVFYAARSFKKLISFFRGRAMTDPLGLDSPVPGRRDFRDFGHMLLWFVGRRPKPTFERWAYWEKFDIWAASADVILIGTTGVMLWMPLQFSAFLPGEAFNVANLIHGKLALLATGFVFAIHFFNTHLRPEKFPMDTSVLTGVVTEEELREERGDYYERLRSENRLDSLRTIAPPRGTFMLLVFAGACALFIGLALLVGIAAGLLP